MAQRLSTFLRFLASLRLGWPIFLCVLAWAAVCQYWMIRSHYLDPMIGERIKYESYYGNVRSDLPNNTILMVVEIVVILLVLRPWSYQVFQNLGRSLALCLLMFIATFYHFMNLTHASGVNQAQALWSAFLFLGALVLLLLGVGAWFFRQMRHYYLKRKGLL